MDYHQWSDLSSDHERSVHLSVTTGHVYIGIHSFTDKSVITWQATIDDETTAMEEEEEEDLTGKEQCKNCHAWVLQRTLVLHEGFCLRNNVLCPWGCGKVFKKDSQELEDHWHCDQCDYIGEGGKEGREKHLAYFHTPKTCSCTHFTTDSYEALSEHKRTTCPEKLITCRFCHVS